MKLNFAFFNFIFFFLLVPPKILHFSFGDEPSYIGDSTNLQCSLVAGDMPVKFSWALNGKSINVVEGVSVGSFGKKMSVLSIDSVEQHHAGNYTCLASNRAATSTYSALLIIKGTANHNQ